MLYEVITGVDVGNRLGKIFIIVDLPAIAVLALVVDAIVTKFGSDLDPATMLVLDKGSKNVELLKQGQYQPFTVGEQAALIFCGTNGLLRKVRNNFV